MCTKDEKKDKKKKKKLEMENVFLSCHVKHENKKFGVVS